MSELTKKQEKCYENGHEWPDNTVFENDGDKVICLKCGIKGYWDKELDLICWVYDD